MMIKGFIMKKNIFIIMALLVMAGNISASEGSRPTTPDQPSQPKDDEGRPICPWAPKKVRAGAGD